MSRNIKYTKSFVREFFNKNDCELLNKNYESIYREKMKFRCKCGNISETMFYSFKKSLSCRECGWKKTSEKLSHLKRNEDFFEKIDTEEKSYWLGFIAADGCVEKKLKKRRYSHRVSVEIKQDDLDHLQKLVNIFGISINKRRREKWNNKSEFIYTCFFALSNKKIVDDLIDKGVVPRKTYKDCSGIIDNISDKFIPDFIRGYFDGDGTICIRKKNGIENLSLASFSIVSYRKEILEKIKKIMVENLFINDKDLSVRIKGKNSQTFSLGWGGRKQLSLIYDYLYKDATIFLDRKKKIFDKIYKYNLQQEKKKKSIYNGVYYFKPCKRWKSYVTINRKQIHIGYYDEEKEAAIAYDRFIINNTNISRYKLNFPYISTKKILKK